MACCDVCCLGVDTAYCHVCNVRVTGRQYGMRLKSLLAYTPASDHSYVTRQHKLDALYATFQCKYPVLAVRQRALRFIDMTSRSLIALLFESHHGYTRDTIENLTRLVVLGAPVDVAVFFKRTGRWAQSVWEAVLHWMQNWNEPIDLDPLLQVLPLPSETGNPDESMDSGYRLLDTLMFHLPGCPYCRPTQNHAHISCWLATWLGRRGVGPESTLMTRNQECTISGSDRALMGDVDAGTLLYCFDRESHLHLVRVSSTRIQDTIADGKTTIASIHYEGWHRRWDEELVLPIPHRILSSDLFTTASAHLVGHVREGWTEWKQARQDWRNEVLTATDMIPPLVDVILAYIAYFDVRGMRV